MEANMKYLFSAIIAVILSVNVFAAGDYFPIKQGNAWLFNYNKSFNSWGSSTTDSGTVRWEVLSVTTFITYPAQVVATVLETKSLCRRTFRPGWAIPGGDTTGYDSVFIPFRVTRDTVLLKGLDPGNGISISNDTCFSFFHDPKGAIPAGKALVRDTSVSCMGKTLAAVVVDPRPCRGDNADWIYYITAPDLGPVEYHMSSSPYIMDAFWGEQWKLVWTNVVPVVGGPCVYSKYIGTAVITGAKRPDTLTNAYDVSFRFFTSNIIQEQWAVQSIGQEKDISAIAGIEGNIALFHIKPGNSYVCTLDVINTGTCTPLIYHLKPPSASDKIDTSSMWIAPDSVVENKAFQLNLLSYYFSCETQFSSKEIVQNTSGIDLYYKGLELPTAGICAPSAKLYGTGFTVPALTAGKYPVYSIWEPGCYGLPLCDIPIMSGLIDTFYVFKALSADMPVKRGNSGAGRVSIYNVKGLTVFEGMVSRPGKVTVSFYSPTGALLGSYSSAALAAGWQRIEVPDASIAGVASAKGPVIVRVILPDGRELRKVFIRM
jgi:hypothetical protein